MLSFWDHFQLVEELFIHFFPLCNISGFSTSYPINIRWADLKVHSILLQPKFIPAEPFGRVFNFIYGTKLANDTSQVLWGKTSHLRNLHYSQMSLADQWWPSMGYTWMWNLVSNELGSISSTINAFKQDGRCLEPRGTGEDPNIPSPHPVKPAQENWSNSSKVPQRFICQLVLEPKEGQIPTGLFVYLPGALREADFNLESISSSVKLW